MRHEVSLAVVLACLCLPHSTAILGEETKKQDKPTLTLIAPVEDSLYGSIYTPVTAKQYIIVQIKPEQAYPYSYLSGTDLMVYRPRDSKSTLSLVVTEPTG